jgi:peptide/nickel transport system substrate-binding protein
MLLLTACSPSGQGGAPNTTPTGTESKTPKQGGTMTVGVAVPPPGLDPIKNVAVAAWQTFQLSYETLVTIDDKGVLQPALATEWSTSPDGLSYTFKLRNNVFFHNGEPFTAEDVKASFDRLKKDGIPNSAVRFDTLNSVEVKDAQTVVFHLTKVTASFLNYMADEFGVASAIVSKKAIADGTNLQTTMVGTGPYQVDEYVPGDHLTLKKFPKYWNADKTGYLDKIVLKFIPDLTAQLGALRSGQIDVMYPDAAMAKVIERDKTVTLKKGLTDWHDGLSLNTQHKPFEDVRVRQAIMLSIDRASIIQGSVLGEGAPSGPIPPADPAAVPVTDLPNYKPSPAQSKQLLTDAGQSSLKFTLMLPTNYPVNVREGEMIQQELSAIGVQVSLDKVEWSVFLKRLTSGDYDAAIFAYSWYPDPELYLIPRPGRTGPMTAKMSDLFAKAQSDATNRVAVYKEIAKLQADEGYPMIWLLAQNGYVAMKPRVHGLEVSGSNSLRGLWTAWVD